jgi:hypothetical protein
VANVLAGALWKSIGPQAAFLAGAAFTVWPAPSSEDTELGVLMEPEVRHGASEVYAGVQA